MGDGLPTPRDGTQRYLKAIHDRLRELLDRFPETPSVAPEGQVELREPAVPRSGGEATAAPESAGGGGSGVKVRRPARTPATPRPRAARKPVKEPTEEPSAAKPAAPKSTKPTPKKGT